MHAKVQLIPSIRSRVMTGTKFGFIRCLYSESRGFKNRGKHFLGFFHCPSDIGVYGGVMKKANNCWRVSCSNIYKVYSAKCLKKTCLIYECPSTFALARDVHEVLYGHISRTFDYKEDDFFKLFVVAIKIPCSAHKRDRVEMVHFQPRKPFLESILVCKTRYRLGMKKTI